MTNTNLPTITFTTEKGGVKPAVRSQIREQALTYLNLADFEKAADGSYIKAVAIDEMSGEPIYVNVSLTITNHLPTKRVAKSKKSAPVVEVPSLF